MFVGEKVAEALGEKLGTEVSIGTVDLGMLNRIILDDILILDQRNEEMLRAPRLAARVNLLQLMQGKIVITSAQIFGVKMNLYRQTAQSQTNFQFVLDSLASKDTTSHTPINLQISSLIIRRGQVSYNQRDDFNRQKFSTKHINLSDISAHLILNTYTDDSLNLNIKKIAFSDRSGLTLKKLSLKLAAGRNDARIQDFILSLPNSELCIPQLSATYETTEKRLKDGTLKFKGKLYSDRLILSDLVALVPILSACNSPLNLSTDVSGTDSRINVTHLNMRQGNDLSLSAEASAWKDLSQWLWSVNIHDLTTSSKGIASIIGNLGNNVKLPAFTDKLGAIHLVTKVNGSANNLNIDGNISTDIGKVDFKGSKNLSHVIADLSANALNLGIIAENDKLGRFSGKIDAEGNIDGTSIRSGKATALVSDFEYGGHTFNNIKATVELATNRDLNVQADIDDAAGNIHLKGDYAMASATPEGSLEAFVSNFAPAALGLTDKWKGSKFDFSLAGNFKGKDLKSATGELNLSDLHVYSENEDYTLNALTLQKQEVGNGEQKITLVSDFATARIEGSFDYATLKNSLISAVYDRLPTIPGLSEQTPSNNHIKLYGNLTDAEWAKHLLGIQLQMNEPAHIIADINYATHSVDINLDANDFSYNGKRYRDGYLVISSPEGSLRARGNVRVVDENGKASSYNIVANAADNRLSTNISFDIDGSHTIVGQLNANAVFRTNDEGQSEADIDIHPSTVLIADTIWDVEPSSITYSKNHLAVNEFSIRHEDQFITVSGDATNNPDDEITVELNKVNVSYILDLVNFHSVDFTGLASGWAKARNIFTKPEAKASLEVEDFLFESGRFGTLYANADWDVNEGAINIDAVAKDEDDRQTIIKGYVSPKDNDIDLKVKAEGTRLEFLHKYTSSFLDNINVYAYGDLEVVGPLNAVQIIGDAKVNGQVDVTVLNTTYTLHNDSVHLEPDDMQLIADTLYDRNSNIGIVDGHLRHKHLGKWTYDIDINAKNFLSYDTNEFGDQTFYGTIYGTGSCKIKGKYGEVRLDIDATPEKGSQLVYNAASPDAIADQGFIHWNDRTKQIEKISAGIEEQSLAEEHEMSSNLFMNFFIHCNTNATLKVMMDQIAGDYIELHGNGTLQASYYNKGAFELYGNYAVESGTYRLTIQNFTERVFDFLSGGSIAFGGNAYNATLNLQARYTLPSVPLSDINIGKSFTNNNIRVDCLMDITGTPAQPRVDFDLDIPTVSTDAKQMVMSLMNSEEERSQQVIYLLAVGRFLNQSENNASVEDASRQSQTSLAMQSIISGTVSQQLSSILDNVVKSNKWNFGANISTGDEGFNNAEYEGLLSGRLLNNRLLLNGQFGYRDNQNATSTFIGDFDVQYLLVPSGSAAVKVYNQTNDKYFTKNSLNTQGIGLILKKDFNGWTDFFRWLKRRKRK